MNQKLSLLVVFFFALGMATFTSCGKDDDVVLPEEVICDSLFNVTITMDTDSILTANANGGTAPYVYLWSTGETDGAIEVSTGGIYSVTATDSNGCIAEDGYC